MRTVYLSLLTILLITYWKVLSRVFRNSAGLTPILGWLVGLGFFLLAPFAIMTLNGGLALPGAYGVGQRWGAVDLENAAFLLPYLMVWLSMMLTCLVVFLFLPSLKQCNQACGSPSRRWLERAILITMALAVADWSLTVWLVGGIEAFLVSHWYLRGEDLVALYGDAYVLVSHLSMANQIVFTSAAALYTGWGLKNHNTKWGFTALIIVFLLAEIILSGNRIYFAIYLFAFFSSCWLFDRKKLIAGLLAVSPILILVFSVWSSVRHDLTAIPESVTEYNQGDFGNRTVASLVNVTEAMSMLLLMHMINDFGNEFDYLYGESYSRTFTSLIPRKIYPQKPDNFTLFLARLYLPGEVTSVSATALGEMYANFGPLTLVLFPLFTFGVVALSCWVTQSPSQHSLLPVVLFVVMVWVARTTFEDNFSTFVLASFLMWLFRLDNRSETPARRFAASAVPAFLAK